METMVKEGGRHGRREGGREGGEGRTIGFQGCFAEEGGDARVFYYQQIVVQGKNFL